MPYLPQKEIWVDKHFFIRNVVELQKLHEKGVELVSKVHARIYDNRPEIKKYNSTRLSEKYWGKQAIEKNEIYYGRMGLVGLFAISLAIAMNYTKIILLGFDFGSLNKDDKYTHFYQTKIPNIDTLSSGVGRPLVYFRPDGKIKNEVEDFKIYLNEKDVKILNVSPNSNISYFDKIGYNQLWEELKNDTN